MTERLGAHSIKHAKAARAVDTARADRRRLAPREAELRSLLLTGPDSARRLRSLQRARGNAAVLRLLRDHTAERAPTTLGRAGRAGVGPLRFKFEVGGDLSPALLREARAIARERAVSDPDVRRLKAAALADGPIDDAHRVFLAAVREPANRQLLRSAQLSRGATLELTVSFDTRRRRRPSPSIAERGSERRALQRVPADTAQASPMEAELHTSQDAVARIHHLLGTGIFHWWVTDREAREALALLRSLPPAALLHTVAVLRASGDYRKLADNLPEDARPTFGDLNYQLDPNVGWLMPGDDIDIEVRDRGGRDDDLSHPYNVTREGVRPITLDRPVPVIGLVPEQAARAIALAYRDALILTEATVRLRVTKRGGYYAWAAGPTRGDVWWEGYSGPVPGSSEARRLDALRSYTAYVATVPLDSPLTVAALGRYHAWIEQHARDLDAVAADPANAPAARWQAALAEAAAPPPPHPADPFLALLASMTRRAEEAPADEKAALQTALRTYTEWLNAHLQDEDVLRRTDPVDIWATGYTQAERDRVHAAAAAAVRAGAEARQEINWPLVGTKIDDAIRVATRALWTVEPHSAEDRTRGIGYLITPSAQERQLRDAMARSFLDDIVRRAREPGFLDTTAAADFTNWLSGHREATQALALVSSYPDVERSAIPIEIPQAEIVVETAVAFIPIVGQVVAAGEAVIGVNLFGRELDPVDRAILGAAVLLPAAAKIFKFGRAAVTAATIARDYRLTATEADVLFRATAGIAPGTRSAAVLERASQAVRDGRPGAATAAERRELNAVLEQMGLTDEQTAARLRNDPARGGSTAERLVAGGSADAERAGASGRVAPTDTVAGSATAGGDRAPGASSTAGQTPGATGGGDSAAGGGAGGMRPPSTILPPAGGGGRAPTLIDLQAASSCREEARVLSDRASQLERARAPEIQARAATLRSRAQQLTQQAAELESGARRAVDDLPLDEISAELDQLGTGSSTARAEIPPVSPPPSPSELDPALPRTTRPVAGPDPQWRTVYRVQSGGGRELVTVDASGNPVFQVPESGYSHFNFGSYDRALEFLRRSRPGGRIVAFEVREDWVRAARSAAIPQTETKAVRDVPRLVDVRFADDQMELPSQLVREMRDFVRPGSGRYLDPVAAGGGSGVPAAARATVAPPASVATVTRTFRGHDLTMPAPRQAGRELAEFGELIGWGTNADGATRRLTQISDMTLPDVTQEIARLRQAGVTRQMAQQWADYYAAEYTRTAELASSGTATRANETAATRRDLMRQIASLLQ